MIIASVQGSSKPLLSLFLGPGSWADHSLPSPFISLQHTTPGAASCRVRIQSLENPGPAQSSAAMSGNSCLISVRAANSPQIKSLRT